MKIAAFSFIVVALGACTTSNDLTVPALTELPDVPRAYYDQPLPAPHFMDRRPDTQFLYDPAPTPNTAAPSNVDISGACGTGISHAVCNDWKTHSKRR